MEPQRPKVVALNFRVPDDLRERLRAIAARKGLKLEVYINRILAAATAAEEMTSPGFLEALEKFLAEWKSHT